VSARLAALHADADGSRRAELAAMTGSSSVSSSSSAASLPAHLLPAWAQGTAADPLSNFYARLEDVRETNRRAGVALLPPPAPSSSSSSAPPPPSLSTAPAAHRAAVLAAADLSAAAAVSSFADDEVFGRYVDLQRAGLFEDFANLPGVREVREGAGAGAGANGLLVPGAAPSSSSSSAAPLPEYAEAASVDYAGYLRRFRDLHASLPPKTKGSRAYRRYAARAAAVLTAFFQRRYPLADLQDLVRTVWLPEFEEAWKAGKVRGWGGAEDGAEDGGTAAAAAAAAGAAAAPLADLAAFASEAALLESLGGEGCKAQLRLRGLKQGGSPAERAARLWSVRGLHPDDVPKKLRAPAAAASSDAPAAAPSAPAPAPSSSSSSSSSSSPFVAVDPVAVGTERLGGGPLQSLACAAWCESVALRLAGLLEDVFQDTRRRVEKRQTKTMEEIQADRAAEVEEATAGGGRKQQREGVNNGGDGGEDDDDDDHEDKPIYNPLDLPLGWDGKPIPYWLYRLHGLNIEFACEICGGESYRGRRDFDRHFQEWRHAHGMRSLGIPNTKHFHDITKIEDAQKRA
jgi:hypothetical protein